MSTVVLSVGSVAGFSGVSFVGTVNNAFELNTDWLEEATKLSISETIDYSEIRYALSKQEFLKFDESLKFNYDSLKTISRFVTSDDFKLQLLNLEEKAIKGGDCVIKELDNFVLINNSNKEAVVVRIEDEIMFELYEGEEMIGLESLKINEFLGIFKKKENIGGNKMKLNIQLFAEENKNLGGISMNAVVGIINVNFNKIKEESVVMLNSLRIVEKVLKENKEKEIFKKSLKEEFNKKFKKGENKMNKVLNKNSNDLNNSKKALKDLLDNQNKGINISSINFNELANNEELLRKEIMERISSKNLSKTIKIITNSMLGKQESFESEFSDLLGMVVSETFGIDYNKLISMTNNVLHGKNKKYKHEQSTDLSFFMLGQERKALEAYIKCETFKEKNLISGVKLNNLNKINSKSFTKEKSSLVNINNHEVFVKLNALAKSYGLFIDSKASTKNGVYITEIKKLNSSAADTNGVVISIPEIIKVNILGQIIEVLKVGDNLYSGSTTEIGLVGDFEKEFDKIVQESGLFRNSTQTYFRLMEEIFMNFDQLSNKDFSNIFFNPKEESDDIATCAFFVRSGSFEDLKEAIYGNAGLPMLQKMARLMGSSVYVRPAAFTSFIVEDFTTLKAEEIFLSVSLKNTGEHTLGGGSGRTGLYFRVINTLQRLLVTDEDKILANSFASNPFIQFKGSRNNNPDGKFINSKYNVRHFNYLGQEIAWLTKAMTVIFLNTSKIPNQFWKGTKVLNTLDNYLYTPEVAELLKTEQDIKDAMKYIRLNSKVKKFLNDTQEEFIFNKIEEILKADLSIKNVRGKLLPFVKQFIEDEKTAEKCVRKITKLPSYIVSKFSAAALKGTAIQINQDIKLSVVDDNLKFLESYMNETLVISNETQHKPEFAMSLASGFHNQIIEQIKNNKIEFVVNYGETTEAKKFNKEDCIKTIVNINGFEIEAYALIVPVNVHDSKNNLAAQGGTTMKEILPNLQFFNSVRGAKDLNTTWLTKNNRSFTRALKAAGYDITFGKWNRIEWSGQMVYVDVKLQDEFNELMVKNNINCIPTNDIESADVVYKSLALEHNKTLFISSGDLTSLNEFVITGNTYHTPVLKKRSILGLTLSEIKKLYNEEEVLFLEELKEEVITEDGSKKKYEILNYMVATNLNDFNEVNDFMLDREVYSTELEKFIKIEGLLTKLGKVRAIEILPGRFLTFEPSMEKITNFFSRELNTVIRAINVVYDNQNLLALEELFFERKINNLEEFFNFAVENYELFKNKYFVKSKEMTDFDHLHNVNGFVLSKTIKEAVVEFTMNLNGIENYHQQKLFTKKANSMYFNRIPGFYGTGINIDCPLNEVRINPNSQGINKEFKENKYGILMRYPTTGELGYGVRIIFDKTIPENVVACHPFTMELLMGDTDGDCLVVLPVSKKIANSQIFRQPVVNLDNYFEGYNTKEDSFFKKWNKEFSKTGLDLRAEAIIERVAAQRQQLQFNPEFVGRITSMNMTLCDVIWKKFVAPVLEESYNKKGDEADKAKVEVNKAKDVYNFFINVVQKQLSQIPIAAKNTTAAGLAQFNETMSNLSNLKSYEEYVLELIKSKETNTENDNEFKKSFNAALGLTKEESLPTGYFMDFINITGWENVEGVEILGYIDVDGTTVDLI